MRLNKKSVCLALALCSCASLPALADDDIESSFYIGLGGGYSLNNMPVSKLDKSIFPDNKYQGSGIFDFFLQYEFGKKKQYAVRLEVDFLKRGGLLNNIYNTEEYEGFYESEGIKDVYYKLRSRYTDIRLPLIYQFCGARSELRPYVYLAPMVCFSTGGKIKSQVDFNDGSYSGSQLLITNGNMRSAYFGGAVGVGLKYDLNIHGHPFYIAFEANYQMGFTDTYSSKEKNGEAVVKDDLFHYVYDITGTRRFNGFEFKGSVSIPLSIFCKKKTPYVEPEPVWDEPEIGVVNIEPEAEEPPCRSIDEIFSMMSRGEDIHGVSFCSIDDIRFETGKSTIYPSSYAYLNKLASILKQTGVEIEVQGHTDNTGTPELNLNLSRDRALAVVKYLKSAGVKSSQLSYTYYGETQPIRSNETAAGRSINRRVEFVIK